MKKKLREHLIMLANQILGQEESFDTTSMKKLVIELHEKLTLLEYLENQLKDIPEVEHKESLDSKSFREENWFTEPEPVPQPEHKEDLIEPLMEKIKDIVAQMPEESERIDGLLDEMLPKSNKQTAVEEKVEERAAEPIEKKVEQKKFTKNDLEEFAANYQTTPEFERKQTQQHAPAPTETKAPTSNYSETKKKSLNDTLNKGLNIGLNDRLAFIKHLFEGQSEDYTRVLSQINTLDNYEEAHSFINQNVKPDYNNWSNKEEYSNRFMAIIERSFN